LLVGSTAVRFTVRITPAEHFSQVRVQIEYRYSFEWNIDMARNVLLVEDSSPARRNIATFLERAGYQVAQADTGEDAVRLIEASGNFDVVVSDLRMPGMINGLDVLSFQNRIAPHAGSILMTAFGSDQIRDQTRRLGAAYIEKPVKLNSLLLEIEKHTRR
jgi:DNA-binding NtrC family response regulator